MIPCTDEEDQDRFALDAAAHQIPYAFATVDQYQAAQLTYLSFLDQHPQLIKVGNTLVLLYMKTKEQLYLNC